MRYFLAHIDDRPDEPWEESDRHEEIYVMPFGTKVAVAVPIGLLGRALPLLAAGTVEVPEPCCPACGESLPASTDD
jgi:hypothetical protein